MVHACLGLAYLAGAKWMVFWWRCAEPTTCWQRKRSSTRRSTAGGLGHFLSALGYELRGEYDEAYIDYWAMHEKGLAEPLVGPALVRLAKRMHRENDLPQLMNAVGDVPPIPEDAAKVVLIAGVGFGPKRLRTAWTCQPRTGSFPGRCRNS